MYLGVVFVYTIILMLISPIIWVVWWLLADLGEKVTGSYGAEHHAAGDWPRRRAA